MTRHAVVHDMIVPWGNVRIVWGKYAPVVVEGHSLGEEFLT
jgi:hypothetical protein